MTPRELQLAEDFDLFELGLLGPEEAAEMRRALADSDELRAKFLARDSANLLLGYSLREDQPSRDARDNFLREMRHSQPAQSQIRTVETSSSQPERRSLLGWPAWAMAAAAIVFMVATGILLIQNSAYRQTNQAQASVLTTQQQQLAQMQSQVTQAQDTSATEQQQLAQLHSKVVSAQNTSTEDKLKLASAKGAAAILQMLRAADTSHFVLTAAAVKPQPQIRTYFRRSTGQVVLIATNLPPVPPGKAYELWMIPADSKTPVPAGMFSPDAHGNVSVTMTQTAANHPAKLFAVTVEPAAGSPTPTSAIVFSGAQGG
jgi:anti-sigma-K factor RskA